MNSKTKSLIIILAALASFLAGVKWMNLKNRPGEATPTPTPPKPSIVTSPTMVKKEPQTTIGSFLVTDKEICLEQGKPVIYYFGSDSCPHCRWEEPIVSEVMEEFKNEVFFHNNMNKQDDQEVFSQYSDINPGYIPFLVFGCKYVRTGSGESAGEVQEKEDLTVLACKLTGSKPASICQPLSEKISQVD